MMTLLLLVIYAWDPVGKEYPEDGPFPSYIDPDYSRRRPEFEIEEELEQRRIADGLVGEGDMRGCSDCAIR